MKQSELYDAIAEALGVSARSVSPQAGNGNACKLGRRRRPLRILLAEDSLANQKLAIGLLSKWGHHVIAGQQRARSGGDSRRQLSGSI